MDNIYNFLTNDRIAMNLWECSGEDFYWLLAFGIMTLMLVWLYAEVALLAIKEWRKHKVIGDLAKGFISLGAVFFFCALTGYLADVIEIFIPMYRIKIFLMIPLIVSTFFLVRFLHTSEFAAKLFNLENELDERIGADQ